MRIRTRHHRSLSKNKKKLSLKSTLPWMCARKPHQQNSKFQAFFQQICPWHQPWTFLTRTEKLWYLPRGVSCHHMCPQYHPWVVFRPQTRQSCWIKWKRVDQFLLLALKVTLNPKSVKKWPISRIREKVRPKLAMKDSPLLCMKIWNDFRRKEIFHRSENPQNLLQLSKNLPKRPNQTPRAPKVRCKGSSGGRESSGKHQTVGKW